MAEFGFSQKANVLAWFIVISLSLSSSFQIKYSESKESLVFNHSPVKNENAELLDNRLIVWIQLLRKIL